MKVNNKKKFLASLLGLLILFLCGNKMLFFYNQRIFNNKKDSIVENIGFTNLLIGSSDYIDVLSNSTDPINITVGMSYNSNDIIILSNNEGENNSTLKVPAPVNLGQTTSSINLTVGEIQSSDLCSCYPTPSKSPASHRASSSCS